MVSKTINVGSTPTTPANYEDTGCSNATFSIETERVLNAYRREVLKSKENGSLLLKFQSVCDEPTDEGMTVEMIYRVLRRKAIKIFGKNFRMNLHKFRYTFATYFVINIGDPFSLREFMGHSNIETTKIYVDLSSKDLKQKHAKHSILVNMEEQLGGQHEVRIESNKLVFEIIKEPEVKK